MKAPVATRESEATTAVARRTNRGIGLSAPGHGIRVAAAQARQTGVIGDESTDGHASLPSPSTARSALQVFPRSIGRIAGPLLQRKLTINEPGDRYEQEADRVAEQVMREGAPPLASPSAGGVVPATRPLQRSCACGGTCADCHDERTLQREEAPGITVAGGGHAAPPIVHDVEVGETIEVAMPALSITSTCLAGE
jgi:hypothetical protein